MENSCINNNNMMPRSLFKDYGNRQTQRPQDEVKQIMRDVTYDYLEEMEYDSQFFKLNPLRQIATLDPSELELNKRIGMGEFGVVLEVTNIHLSEKDRATEEETVVKPLHRFNSKSCGAFPTPTTTGSCCDTFTVKTSPQHVQLLRQILANKVLRMSESDDYDQLHYHHQQKQKQQQQHQQQQLQQQQQQHTTVRIRPTGPELRPRFAVKQIRKDLYPKKKIEAGKDLAREAKLLSRIEHPNIIRLRAIVGQPGEEDFMLLLDRLGITLSEQVTQWHERLARASAGIGFPWGLSTSSSQRKVLERTVLSERLLALYDVARAMHHLHQKSILFRDLKTENVARNHHGAFQLLDFGLAKEVKERDRVGDFTYQMATSEHYIDTYAMDMTKYSHSQSNDFKDMYKMTGLTGTMRIMSPEVLQCQPYGLSADVYSYGIVLWEVFQGQRNQLSAPEVIKGQRPELPVVGMPSRIESLVKKCYASPAFRPTFAMLSQELEYQLIEFQQQEWQTETDAQFSISVDRSIFHRLEYLRQLSVQSLATSTSAVTAVEN